MDTARAQCGGEQVLQGGCGAFVGEEGAGGDGPDGADPLSVREELSPTHGRVGGALSVDRTIRSLLNAHLDPEHVLKALLSHAAHTFFASGRPRPSAPLR